MKLIEDIVDTENIDDGPHWWAILRDRVQEAYKAGIRIGYLEALEGVECAPEGFNWERRAEQVRRNHDDTVDLIAENYPV